HKALAQDVAIQKRARGLESGARRAFYGTIVSALAATANSAICRSPTHAAALAIASAAPVGRASDARSPKANANTQLSFVFIYRSAASVMPISNRDRIANLKQCVGSMSPCTAARVHAPLRYQKKGRRDGRVLLLIQLLPRILHRGAHGLDLDVGELAADPSH